LIARCLGASQPGAVQAAACQAIGDVGSPELASLILGRWGELATDTRREVCAGLLRSPMLVPRLVDALETATISPLELDVSAREALGQLSDLGLRRRAASALARFAPAPRAGVLRAYAAALTRPGNARRGAELFATHCQACHQHQGKGHRVGPDLSDMAARPAAALLHDILDPNENIAPDYVNFSLVTREGQVRSGLLVEETSTSVKLRRAFGAEETILRSDIEEIRASGRSLMPEGLEQVLGIEAVADLLAYLRNP
jgi:putative heme-binding domain-containing protein